MQHGCTASIVGRGRGRGQGWGRHADPTLPQDFLGQAFCTLGEIVGSAGSRLEKPLT